MKVNSVVKSTIGQIDKVSRRNGHLLRVEFGLEGPHGRFEGGSLGHDITIIG